MDALDTLGKSDRFEATLDLGCGTGLMARALNGKTRVIDGIDLSPLMIKQAKKCQLYRHLWVGELVEWLQQSTGQTGHHYDLVIAADVMVYLGDLVPACTSVKAHLTPQGLLAFTVQASKSEGYQLGEDYRYAHSADYLQMLAQSTGYDVVYLDRVVTRKDGGKDVPGFLCILRPSSAHHP